MRKLACYFATIIGLISACGAPAAAHDFWIAWQAPQLVVSRGHAPDTREAYDPSRVGELLAFDSTGIRLEAIRHNEKDRVVFNIDGAPSLATVHSEWGHRVQTTIGKRKMTSEQAEIEGLTVLKAFSSTHHAKSAFPQSPLLWQDMGLRFEFVLTGAPAQITAPGEVGIQLLFDGEPLVGAEIHYARTGASVQTDDEGRARIRLEGDGLHVLQAMHEIAAEEVPGLDAERHMTFMTFSF